MLRLRLLRFPRFAILSILLLIALLAVVPGVSASSPNSAPPMVTLSPAVGPPTSTVQVHGSHFGSYEAVDVYFDTTDKALAATNGQGAFSISIKVSANAVPGKHWVTAVGRHSGRSAQAPFKVQTDWPQLGYDHQRTGSNPYENVLSPANVGSLVAAWSTRIIAGKYTSAPVVANGVVYVDTSNSHTAALNALNAQTGTQLWSAPVSGNTGIYISPAVVNGVVYFGTNENFYALNAQTGTQLWSVAVYGGADSSAPAVVNGVVYFGSGYGQLYALNAQTGTKLWSFRTLYGDSSPAVANGIVYTCSGGSLYALNAQTGTQLWSTGVGNNAPPVVANGIVYISPVDIGYTYAFNAQTGAKLWSAATGNNLFSTPAVVNGIVYVGSYDDHLYALNAQTGTQLWTFATGSVIQSSPAVANGVVYFGSDDGYLYALNAQTGAQLWFAVNPLISAPVVVNGILYICPQHQNRNVYAYALPPGKQVQPLARPNPATLRPNLTLSVQP